MPFKREFRFKREMLRGHPGNVTRAVKRVIVRGHNHELVVTSTTDGVHSPTSFHAVGKAVDFGNLRRRDQEPGQFVGADPGSPEARRLMVRFQRHLLNVHGPSAFREVFGPDNNLNVKNGVRITLGEGTPLENQHDTHVHVAPARIIRLPKRSKAALAALRRRRQIRRAQRAGAKFVPAIFEFAEKHNVQRALALALFQKESNFINQYGHDRDRHGNIIWHGKAGLVRVTEANYKNYLAFRKRTGLPQGVGLGQLTSAGIQDTADRRGGCWRVRPNVDVSLETLAGHIKALGVFKGVGAYNGGRGNPQDGYARAVLKLRDEWQKVLN